MIAGLLITFLTGFVSRTPLPPANTPPILVGARWYGVPLVWLMRLVVAPEYFPWRVEILGLVTDIVVWTTVVGLLLTISKRMQEPMHVTTQANSVLNGKC